MDDTTTITADPPAGEARLRTLIRQVLRAHGVDKAENRGLHSWRCQYPERYGQCTCFNELVDALTQRIKEVMS